MTSPRKPYTKPVIVSEGRVADLTRALVGHTIIDSHLPNVGDSVVTDPITTGPLLFGG